MVLIFRYFCYLNFNLLLLYYVAGNTSETWPMTVEDMARLERTERMMVKWMCGVHLKSRTERLVLNLTVGLVLIW